MANAAEFLGLSGEFGTVAVGARADLLLLDADPLSEVANAGRRAGVMARGRWLARSQLRAMLKSCPDLSSNHATKVSVITPASDVYESTVATR